MNTEGYVGLLIKFGEDLAKIRELRSPTGLQGTFQALDNLKDRIDASLDLLSRGDPDLYVRLSRAFQALEQERMLFFNQIKRNGQVYNLNGRAA